jgi:hypothetical protein
LKQLVAEVGGTEADVLRVVRAFSEHDRHFLVTSDDPPRPASVVDISHESLIRLWSRLRGWLLEESDWKRRYAEIVTAAKRHAARKGSTWRDPELAIARRWIREDADPPWASRYGESDDFRAAVTFLNRSERVQATERWTKRALWAVVPLALAIALAVWVYGEWKRDAELAEQKHRFEAEVQRVAAESGVALQKALENQRITVRELEEARTALQGGGGTGARTSPAAVESAREAIERVLALLNPAADFYYDRQQDLARLQRQAGTTTSGTRPTTAAPPAASRPTNALRGYKVGIYFIDGHAEAASHARSLEAGLRKVPELTVQQYPRTQAFMVQVNPPRGDEIRYEGASGDERRAAEALRALAAEMGFGEFALRTVVTPTPGFISIVLDDGVQTF